MSIPIGRPITIIHTSPWKLYREGVKRAFERKNDIEIIGEAASGHELLNLLELKQPDLIIIDINMSVSGIETLTLVRKRFPELKIIVLTIINDQPTIAKALEQGINGYLTIDAGSDEIYEAIISVFRTNLYIRIGGRYPGRTFDCLNAYEINLIKKLSQNFSPEVIARNMDLTTRTVDALIEKLLYLSGTSNTEELIALARKKGFIEQSNQHRAPKLPFWKRIRIS